MNVLFIHQNFPGQFVHLASALARDSANRVVALTINQEKSPAGVIVRPYKLLRKPAAEVHALLRHQEAHVLRAEACAAAAFKLKQEGFTPDVIVAHGGWGEALFIKDVFPQAKLVVYCEYYYAAEGQDVGFDPEFSQVNFETRCHLRLQNTTNLLSMEIADAGISPTQWQKSTYPAWVQEKISVIHDGIDFERLKPNPDARVQLAANAHHGALSFKPGDEVLTYVSRNLEPVRGFHIFMRSLPEVLRRRPKAHVIIAGGNEVSYGRNAPGQRCWRDHMLHELQGQIDLKRVHFVGSLPYQTYLDVLHVSKVHTYLTVPFVLSWSFLEAAAAGCTMVASATAPVEEFAQRLKVATLPFLEAAGFSDAYVDKLTQKNKARNPNICSETELAKANLARMKMLTNLIKT